ncbi:MAG: hypothetical protein HZA90_00815 [Verrucomicrobia bacterium]|nr:hypothetical protein [Verrucomicrobiota bacterium]
MKKLLAYLSNWIRMPVRVRDMETRLERLTFDVGCVQARLAAAGQKDGGFPGAAEFQVFSQAGDDGILQHMVHHVPIAEKFFVEFGIQNYRESNTRFLLLKDNWRGLVMDGSAKDIARVKQDPLYLRHDLAAACEFITAANINALLQRHVPGRQIGLLSIDIDGNDYWIWKAIDSVEPAIVVTEYNHRFGPERAVTIPYRPDFVRPERHATRICYGASLKALWLLAQQKGYDLVACNRYGNNAFWVKTDLRPAAIAALRPEQAFVAGQFREAWDESGEPLRPEQEQALLRGLELVEVDGR